MLGAWSPNIKTTLGMQGWGEVRVPGAPAQQSCCGSALGFLAFLGPASPGSSEPLEKRRSPGAGAWANSSIESPFKGFVAVFFPPA